MNLIFDLDDTLYDMMQPFVRACHTIWEAPLPFDPWALFIRSRRISDQLYPLIAQGKMSVDEVGTARILQAAQELGEDIGEQAARSTTAVSNMKRSSAMRCARCWMSCPAHR